MSYYGLPPTKYAKDLNSFEKTLRNLPVDGAIEALALLEKITRNVVHSPNDEKYRRIRRTNEKMAPLINLSGSSDILSEMGWVQDGDAMVLPQNVKLDFQLHVVKIVEAKDYYLDAKEKQKAAGRRAADPNKAEMLHQLELDRKEREASQNLRKPDSNNSVALHQLELDRQERSASLNSPMNSPMPQEVAPTRQPAPLAVLGVAAAQASKTTTSQSTVLSPPPSPEVQSRASHETRTFITGEVAEVRIIEGVGAGNWVRCKVVGPGRSSDSHEIYIMPTADYDYVGGFSGKNIPDMSVQYLRKAQWTCPRCTLSNKLSSARCEACGAIAPSHDQPTGLSRVCGDCSIC